MPAAVAKGLILSISLLIAAGIAVYDIPQVRDWIDESKRKIALAVNGANDDPQRRRGSRLSASRDASTQEDSSPGAIERRRQAREDILRRGRINEERRRKRAAQAGVRPTPSFDHLVNSDGSLIRNEKNVDLEAMTTAITTAAEKIPDEGLRNRTKEAVGFAMGTTAANPFADEMDLDASDEKALLEQVEQATQSRERSATLRGDSPLVLDTSLAQSHLGEEDAASGHASELLVDLTPTTSVAPSASGTLLSSPAALTPTSTVNPDAQQRREESQTQLLQQQQQQQQQPLSTSFQSIQEWASATTGVPASFYSPPESERQYREMATPSETRSQATSTAASLIGSSDLRSEGMENVDTLSDAGGISTPSTWSEIGSVVSEE